MTDIHELFGLLENLYNLHRALLTLATKKKDILVKGDTEELASVTQNEHKIIKAIVTTEASRVEKVQQLFADKGLPLMEGTLLELIKCWTVAEDKARLNKYREELIRIVAELRQANELNQQLLEQSLSFVNASLDLLTDTPEEDFIYKKPTNFTANSQSSRSFINRKA